MTRHETFAASALQGLIAARTNFDIQEEVETAWRYADGMEAEAARRDRRLIGEVLDAYGRATDAGGKPFFGRCELSHTFAEVCRFAFQPKQAEPS